MILIQHIKIFWTKESRGARGASKRAAVPEVLSFPCPELPELDSVWMHMNGASEGEDFQLRSDIFPHPMGEPILVSFYELVHQENSLKIRLGSQSAPGSATALSKWPAPCELLLNRGQTAQWRVQARQQGWEEPWYERDILNVAWLERYDSEVFRNRPFDQVKDDLPQLS